MAKPKYTLRLTAAANTISGRVGTLTSLSTTEKTSIVAALNEVKASIPTLASLITEGRKLEIMASMLAPADVNRIDGDSVLHQPQSRAPG